MVLDMRKACLVYPHSRVLLSLAQAPSQCDVDDLEKPVLVCYYHNIRRAMRQPWAMLDRSRPAMLLRTRARRRPLSEPRDSPQTFGIIAVSSPRFDWSVRGGGRRSLRPSSLSKKEAEADYKGPAP